MISLIRFEQLQLLYFILLRFIVFLMYFIIISFVINLSFDFFVWVLLQLLLVYVIANVLCLLWFKSLGVRLPVSFLL